MMSAEFAKYLSRLRRSSGISQREAATALGVSQALLSHYEKGIREPGLDFVIRAADYYGVSTDHLLGRMPTQPKAPEAHPHLRAAETGLGAYTQGTEQAIRDALDVVLDLLGRTGDPGVFSYATIYLGEVLYELLRHFFRLSGEYDPRLFFSLSDESLDSGAVVSDITWVRAQYILAIKQLGEAGPRSPMLTRAQFEERYDPQVYESLKRMFFMVSRRISQQGMNERQLSQEGYGPGQRPAGPHTNPNSNQEASL